MITMTLMRCVLSLITVMTGGAGAKRSGPARLSSDWLASDRFDLAAARLAASGEREGDWRPECQRDYSRKNSDLRFALPF